MRRPRPDLLALAVACCLSLSAHAAEDITNSTDAALELRESTDEVYLQVTVNEQTRPSVYRFVNREGKLFASPSTLIELGLRVDPADVGKRLIAIDRDGVQVIYDSGAQTLSINARVVDLSNDTTQLNSSNLLPKASPAPWGALLNYDVDAYHSGGVSNVVVAPAIRVFGPGNTTLESNGIVQADDTDRRWRSRAIRLDSRIRWTSPDTALEVILGDVVTGGPEWARQTRMGGLRIGTNYASLQPYRILSPGPVFNGESALPSNVELYVNGIKQFEGETPAGRFVVSGLPSMEGLGNARLVLTDAYGRARSVDIPFYGTRRLLSKGLDDWSISLGRVRLDYGSTSNHYDRTTALDASWRHGFSDKFTGELHVEARSDLRLTGAGGAVLLGKAGVLNAAWSESRSRGLKGNQTRWGYQWSNGTMSVAFDSQRTHGDYRDIAAVSSGFLPARRSESANVGFTNKWIGSFNLNYANLQYPEQARTRIAGAYWNRAISRNWFINAGAQRDLDHRSQNSFQFGFSAVLGPSLQSSGSIRRSGGRDIYETSLLKQARANGDFGWRLQARQDSPGNIAGLAEGTWLTRAVELSAAVASGNGNQYRAAARGSVLWMGRSLFAAREVINGFALVDTGVAGVPVRLENRPYGVTNKSGQLILTPVYPFQVNHISIDPNALPANVRVPRKELEATPGASGAARVDFQLQNVHAAVVVITDETGTLLPMGGAVHLVGGTGTEADTIIGYDGEIYLEGLSKTNTLEVTRDAGRCIARFNYDENTAAIPRIEPVMCKMEVK